MNTKPSISVAIADGHPLFTKGIISSLSYKDDLKFVLEALNGQYLLSFMKHTQVDVVLLHTGMPVLDGIDTLIEIKELYPTIGVIMMLHDGGVSDYDVGARLMELGASSCIEKSSLPEEIYEAICDVYNTDFHFNKFTSQSLLYGKRASKILLEVNLTEKELEILKLMCQEKSTKEIADMLDLSPRTIEAYRGNIKLKTGRATTAGLIVFAIEAGLAEPANVI